MIDQEQMKRAVKAYIDKGIDFLIEEAKEFVKEKRIYELSSSQMNCLKSIYDKYSDDFTKQKEEVREFVKKQQEKDEKRKNKVWSKAGDPLIKRIFEFSDSEKGIIKDKIKKYMPKSDSHIVEQLFYGGSPELNEWIKGTLEQLLSHAMFDVIYTYYRCKKEKLEE